MKERVKVGSLVKTPTPIWKITVERIEGKDP